MIFKNRVVSSPSGGSIVDNYDPFGDGSGIALFKFENDATDESGNYDGTATSITYGDGEFGQSAIFDETASRVVIPSTTGVKAVGMWVNRDSASAAATALVLDNRISGTSQLNWSAIDTWAMTDISLLKVDGVTKVAQDATPADDTWVFVYMEFASYSGQITLGNYNPSPIYGFGGGIDQVRLFSRNLTTAEQTIIENEST